MELYLFDSKHGTKSGFIVTKKDITMVYQDRMITFRNDESGRLMIDKLLAKRERGSYDKVLSKNRRNKRS